MEGISVLQIEIIQTGLAVMNPKSGTLGANISNTGTTDEESSTFSPNCNDQQIHSNQNYLKPACICSRDASRKRDVSKEYMFLSSV